MNFQPELAAKVLAGDNYAVCPGRGKHSIGRVRVTGVRLVRLGDVDDAEARLEGFEDAAAFAAAFLEINGEYDADLACWRIAFEVVT